MIPRQGNAQYITNAYLTKVDLPGPAPNWSLDGRFAVLKESLENRTSMGYDGYMAGGADGKILFSRLLWWEPEVVKWRRAIFTINADGSGLRQLTAGNKCDIVALWSRDGSNNVFISRIDNADKRTRIYVTRTDAIPGQERLVSDPACSEKVFSCLKDGRLIIDSDRGGTVRMYALTPASETVSARYQPLEVKFNVTGTPERYFVSPDESKMLMLIPNGNFACVADFNTKTLVMSKVKYVGAIEDIITMDTWSRDGSKIFLLCKIPGGTEIRVFYLVSQKMTVLAPVSEVPYEDICQAGDW